MASNNDDGTMSTSEAGKMGGKTVADKYGHEHFEEIGHKGGQKVKRLVEEGKELEGSGE